MIQNLLKNIETVLKTKVIAVEEAFGEITLFCDQSEVISVLTCLRDHPDFNYDQLIDLCGVDYLLYGVYDWETESATDDGFSRGVHRQLERSEYVPEMPARFAVVYHLLSTQLNQRIRVKVFLPPSLIIPSVHDIWSVANWFEREAYDLYGILFENHPDLRRILTDYGFIGHPFRKDFPISGHVQMRYDAAEERVIYEPVDIEPRVLVPKVIRDDNRYLESKS